MPFINFGQIPAKKNTSGELGAKLGEVIGGAPARYEEGQNKAAATFYEFLSSMEPEKRDKYIKTYEFQTKMAPRLQALGIPGSASDDENQNWIPAFQPQTLTQLKKKVFKKGTEAEQKRSVFRAPAETEMTPEQHQGFWFRRAQPEAGATEAQKREVLRFKGNVERAKELPSEQRVRRAAASDLESKNASGYWDAYSTKLLLDSQKDRQSTIGDKATARLDKLHENWWNKTWKTMYSNYQGEFGKNDRGARRDAINHLVTTTKQHVMEMLNDPDFTVEADRDMTLEDGTKVPKGAILWAPPQVQTTLDAMASTAVQELTKQIGEEDVDPFLLEAINDLMKIPYVSPSVRDSMASHLYSLGWSWQEEQQVEGGIIPAGFRPTPKSEGPSFWDKYVGSSKEEIDPVQQRIEELRSRGGQ